MLKGAGWRLNLVLVVAWLSWPVTAISEPLPADALKVANGFAIEAAVPPDASTFPMFGCFDDMGRLYVAESSGLDLYAELAAQTRRCRVRVYEDVDGDGFWETNRVFADKLVFPMGLAWNGGHLYVADPPDLVAFATTGETQPERRVILTGFGHRDNGSLHGLIFGPDGMLYMTMGSPDGYKLRLGDGSFLEGTSGALLRCRPNGTAPEVMARGFENLIEVVFTAEGDILGTDNWFKWPHGGERDALVHLLEGGLYPLNQHRDAPPPLTGHLLPALAIYPAVALSGLELYEGTQFPREFQHHLFSAQHNTRKVVRHALVRQGHSFSVEDHDFVWSEHPDFHPADTLEAPDGSLLVLDTGAWYVQHCPTGKIRSSQATGGIYRVRAANSPKIADPCGLDIRWARLSGQELLRLLADARPKVRWRAREQLRQRPALPELRQFLKSAAPLSARQQAMWSLGPELMPAERTLLHEVLGQEESLELIAVAARLLGLAAHPASGSILAKSLLSRQSVQGKVERTALLEGLARCGGAPQFPLVLAQFELAGGDPMLEHAVLHAAHQIALRDPGLLAAEAQHLEKSIASATSTIPPERQRAVLRLLTQPSRSHLARPDIVLALAISTNAPVQHAALDLLSARPEWSPRVAQLIERLLNDPAMTARNGSPLHNLLAACANEPSIQEVMAKKAAETSDPLVAAFLLEAMRESSLAAWPASWVAAVSRRLAPGEAPPLQLEAIRATGMLRESSLLQLVHALATNGQSDLAVRIEALKYAAWNSRLDPPTTAWMQQQLQTNANPLHRFALSQILSPPSTNAAPASQSSRHLGQGEVSGTRRFEQIVASSGGEARRGRVLFLEGKGACLTCHQIGGQGGLIGPDLTRIGGIRSRRDLVESILFPSSTFAQRYQTTSVLLRDGEQVDGIIVREEPARVVLRAASGAEIGIAAGDIRELRPSQVSLMPEGLSEAFTDEEFLDLLAFLQSLK